MTSGASSSSSPPTQNKWANLLTDILEVLARSLQWSFERRHFGSVCTSWRDAAAAVKQNAACRPRRGVDALPLMTFIEPVDGVKGGPAEAPLEVDEVAAATPVIRCFYSLSEDKVYHLQVPSESRLWRCFGSSRGWLGMVDLCINTFLFDPILGARVDLPPLTTLDNLVVFSRRRKKDGAMLYVCEDPLQEHETRRCFTGTEARDHLIRRLALSSPLLEYSDSCIVMAIIDGLPAYATTGGDSWTHVPNLPPGSKYGSDIIYHDGRFYALADSGETIAVDFVKSPKSRTHPQNCDLVRPTVEVIVSRPPLLWPTDQINYLVALPSGELAQVIRHVRDHRKSYETEAFKVLKLTVGGDHGEDGRWVKDNHIGDCCLFLGFIESMSLPALEVLGKYRTNCIFFTDNVRGSYYGQDYGGLDFGVYDFEKKTIDHFCRIDERRLMPPPMWITPNP